MALRKHLQKLDADGSPYWLNCLLTDGSEACGPSLGVDDLGVMLDGTDGAKGGDTLPRFVPWASVRWVAVEAE